MYTLANITVVYRGRFCWCGYSAMYTAIGGEFDPVKSNRYEDPMAVNNNNNNNNHSGHG